ncbi:MAG: murein biosynthesis integral membrane protein MurJ [Minisyncoccia bacterium]
MKISQPLKKFLNYKSETIFGAGLLMSLLTFVGSLLGLVRNALLASHFGASHSLDVYYASFRLPDLIYNIFIIGAISAAFIPLFNEYLAKDKDRAWQFSNFIIIFIGCLLGILGILIALFARPLLSRLLIGFDSTNLASVILLTRIMMIQPILLGISSVISGILRSFRLFFITTLAPLMYNLGIIIGIIFFVPLWGLKGLAWGVVFGAALHLIIQLPSLLEVEFRFRLDALPSLRTFSHDFKQFLAMMSSRTSSIIISQLFLLGITSLTTLLKSGTLTIFSFVDSILPYTTFALPFADAAFPKLSRVEADKQTNEFWDVFISTLNHILFFMIPLAIWFIVFREPITRLLLGYGKFNWQATTTTMQVLSIMAIGMIFQGLNYFLLKVFFAKKDAKNPFWASLLTYSLGLVLCYILSSKFQIPGLAWGMVATYILYTFLLVILLRKHISFSSEKIKSFVHQLINLILVSSLSGLVGFITLSYSAKILSLTRVIYLLLDAGLAFTLSLAVFIMVSLYLKVDEIHEFKILVRNKIYGKQK